MPKVDLRNAIVDFWYQEPLKMILDAPISDLLFRPKFLTGMGNFIFGEKDLHDLYCSALQVHKAARELSFIRGRESITNQPRIAIVLPLL